MALEDLIAQSGGNMARQATEGWNRGQEMAMQKQEHEMNLKVRDAMLQKTQKDLQSITDEEDRKKYERKLKDFGYLINGGMEVMKSQSDMKTAINQARSYLQSKKQAILDAGTDEDDEAFESLMKMPDDQFFSTYKAMHSSIPMVQDLAMKASLYKSSIGGREYATLTDVVIDGKTYKVPFDHRTKEYLWDQKQLSPKDPTQEGAVSESKKSGQIKGEDKAKADVGIGKVRSDAQYLKGLVMQAVKHPGFRGAVGMPSIGKVKAKIPGTEEAGFMSLQDQITGKQFMTAYETLKGGGQITEIEGQKATDALSRMRTSVSEEEYISAANEFISEIDRLVSIAEERMSEGKKPENSGIKFMGWE